MNFLCVVPVYNEDEKIQQLCSEIKEFQSNNKNIDFLLINNGSTDKSREIMETFNALATPIEFQHCKKRP